MSHNSKDILDEAGIVTSDPAAIRRASDFFDKLCTEPVGTEYLKKCISEYRPPKFKPAVERPKGRSKGSRRVIEAKLWFVGGLAVLKLSKDVVASIEKVVRPYAKRLQRREQTEVTWFRFPQELRFLQQIRVGNREN